LVGVTIFLNLIVRLFAKLGDWWQNPRVVQPNELLDWQNLSNRKGREEKNKKTAASSALSAVKK